MKRLLRIGAALLGLLGLICLGMFLFKGGGNGKLSWDDPIVRKSVMTFAYKIYGDPSVESGRLFLSKIVFHNDGTELVRDLSVSYQIPDYVPWTTPQTHSELPAGQTVVELYYPQLPSKVTQLTSQTNATLETKIRWSNKAGETREEILRSPIIFRGVNEIEYTDLPQSEVMTWYDMFATAEFAVAMVTPNDPVVKEFVAEVTKRTGGTLAGASNSSQDVSQIMKGVYDYMCETGMRYTSDEGVPSTLGDIQTTVQTVRMPRDVIITNQGLCVELAILWASVMEHLGCRASLIFKQHHAFTIVYTQQGRIPIECTAITPKAIPGALKALGLDENTPSVPFEKAVLLAQMELEDLETNNRQYLNYNVQRYQQLGMHAPELPNIEVDKIKSILAQRTAQNAARQGGGAANNGQVRQGYYRWVGPNNLAVVEIPDNWPRKEDTTTKSGQIFQGGDGSTPVAVFVFYFPDLANAAQAMAAFKKAEYRASGGTVKVASQEAQGNTTFYRGKIVSRKFSVEWMGWFKPEQNGVVGLLFAAQKGQLQRNAQLVNEISSSAKLGTK